MALTEEEDDWAFQQLEVEVRGQHITENYRSADPTDDNDMAFYKAAEDRGSGPSVGLELVHPVTGRTILVGCNYGN